MAQNDLDNGENDSNIDANDFWSQSLLSKTPLFNQLNTLGYSQQINNSSSTSIYLFLPANSVLPFEIFSFAFSPFFILCM